MENTHQVIENFFNEKIHKSISDSYEDILKTIRDKKKNHKHKENLEKYTKEDDAFEFNQWLINKIQRLAIFFISDKKIPELIDKTANLFQEITDPIELKTAITTQFKEIKKEVSKSQLSEQDKQSFEKIDAEKLQSNKFEKNKRLLEKLIEIDTEISIAMVDAKKIAQGKFERNKWISHAATKAGSVSVEMTHIAKLTHSSARASNFNALSFVNTKERNAFLTTENFAGKLPTDFSYTTAEYSPIAEFLQLVGKDIINNDFALKAYAQNDEQLQQWKIQFSEAFNEKDKSSHALVKQVYFPVSLQDSYHLLMPLISSSMAHIIYERIWATRKRDMIVRKARKTLVYCSELDTLFNDTAILKVTQSKKAHTNVSSLNVKRDGQLFLFPAIPPTWQTQTKPPIHLKTIFNRQLANQAQEPLTELKNLLLAIKANALSINRQRKQLICDHITNIAGVVFDYVAEIQRLKQHMGWSQHSRLPSHQHYWLDPLRPDEDFQAAKTTLDWSSDIVNDFSRWINRSIKHKQLTLGLVHEKQWQKLFARLLREFNALADIDLDNSTMEEQA